MDAFDYRAQIRRPVLTPLLLSSFSLWCGTAITYGNFANASIDFEHKVLFLSVIFFVISLLITLKVKHKIICFIIVFFMLGIFLGTAQAITVQNNASMLSELSDRTLQLTLEEDTTDRGFGREALTKVTSFNGDKLFITTNFGAGEPLYYGQHFEAKGTFKAADFSKDLFSWNEGACGTFRPSFLKEAPIPFPIDILINLRIKAINALGDTDEGRKLLQALICGYRQNVSGTENYNAYQTCGLAHLIAVSGAHLVIVTGLFAVAFKALRLPRWLNVSLSIFIIVSYLIFSGAPISALRAALMSSIGLLSLFGKRRPSSLNALGIGIIIIIATMPQTSLSVSFTLSALSTAGIVLFAPLIQLWLSETPLGRFSFINDGLSLTLASSMLSQLYACSIFSLLPLISPLANIASGPFFPLVCSSGLLATITATFSIPGSEIFINFASFIASFLNGLVGFLSKIPFASIPFTCDTTFGLLISALLAFLLWGLWPPRRQMTFCSTALLGILLLYCFIPLSGDRIVMFDVGQGDSILIQSQGQTLLIDTGNKDNLLKQELAQNRITKLTALAITHADDDHCGSLDVLDNSVVIENTILAKGMLECPEEKVGTLVTNAKKASASVIEAKPGNAFDIGSFHIKVLWPEKLQENGGNADSLCLWFDYDGNRDGKTDYTALFTGDAEKEEIQTMIDKGLLGPVDILKVGHHGSKNALTEEELSYLKPKIALIGVGAANRYGHPHESILSMLEKIDTKIYRTDKDGEVTCSLSAQSLKVQTLP